MPSTTRCLIVIAAADQATENQWIVDNIDPAGGMETFTAPLTAIDSIISNYWSGGIWYDDQFAKLQDHFGNSLYTDIAPDDLLAELNLHRFVSPT